MGSNNDTMQRQARLFRMLMHPARIAILEALRYDEACVCHLEAQLQARQAYLSQQLAVLRKAGLISDRRDGLNIFYRIAQPEVLTVLDAARGVIGADRAPPPPPAGCSCPKCIPVDRFIPDPIALV